jgi:septation ring formation regulator EzrA
MGIDIENISEEQNRFIQSYKRINERLETLQKQMTLIQYETQGLLTELEDLRNMETKKYKNGKK